MKVFISWSGPLSQKVAEILKPWIRCVLQATDPFFSPEGIAKGSLWFNQISDQLADTGVGIICLTPDNLNAPWILFEAGALAKGLSMNRVYTLLINLNYTDLKPPLSQFNATWPNKEGMLKLFSSINSALGERGLSKEILGEMFAASWETYEPKLYAALASHKPMGHSPRTAQANFLDEILPNLLLPPGGGAVGDNPVIQI